MRKIEKKVNDAGRTTFREAIEGKINICGRDYTTVYYKPVSAIAAQELVTNDEAKLYDYSIRDRVNHTECGAKFFVISNVTTEKEGITGTYMASFCDWEAVVDEMAGAKDYPRNLGGRVEDVDGNIIATFDGEGNYEVIDSQAEDTEPKEVSTPITGETKQVFKFSKTYCADMLADMLTALKPEFCKQGVQRIKKRTKPTFEDVSSVAQRVLDEGFDAFTVGDYLQLIA